MQSLLQALNIGTLATWLSVSGASTVAWLVPIGDRSAAIERDLNLSEGDVIDLDAESSQPAAGSAAPAEAAPEMAESTPVEPVALPEVAPLPEVADVTPLPEIPELPKAEDLQSDLPKPQTQPAPARKATTATTQSRSTGGTPGATGVGSGTGSGSATGSGSGSAGAGAARLSKGRIPTPKYPEDCRRNNQEGRVVVTFTVDESGNVVGAKVSGKSPYPAMDQAAVDAVYRGKFPAGPGRATASKAIVFKLR